MRIIELTSVASLPPIRSSTAFKDIHNHQQNQNIPLIFCSIVFNKIHLHTDILDGIFDGTL